MQTFDDLQRNLNYKIKAQEIGLASWKGQHGTAQKMTIPTKDFLLNSASRQQDIIKMRNDMVEDYLDDQKTPIKAYDQYGQEIGEYKYHNIPPPDLNYDMIRGRLSTPRGILDIDITPDRFKEFNEIGFGQIMEDNTKIHDDAMFNIENELSDLKLDLLAKVEEGKDMPKKFAEIQQDVISKIDNSNMSEEKKAKEKRKFMDKARIQFATFKKDYQIDLRRLRASLKRKEEEAQNELNRNVKFTEEVEEIRARVQNEMKRNEEKVKNYAQELNNLNKGELSTSKNFNETDEEYLQRLQDIAAVPYADARSEAKALSREKEKLRENMKLIIRSNATIDQVVNSLYANEPLLIYELNKYFNGFKEYFIKKFGSNNEKIDFREIIREIGFYLKRATDPNILKGNVINPSEIAQKVAENLPIVPYQRTGDIIPPLSSEVILPETQSDFLSDMFDIINQTEETLGELKETAPAYLTGEEEESQNLFNIELIPPLVNNTLVITNSKGKKIYLKWSRKNIKIKNGQEFKAPIFYISESGNPGTFYDSDYRSVIDKLSSLFNVSKLEIYKLFGKRGDYRKFTKDDLELGLSSRGLLPTFDDPRILKINPVTIGYGIKHAQDIPDKVNFGSNILFLKKLFLKNILSIQNKHNTKINGFNNVNVSDNFVKIIMNLLKNIDFTNNDLQNLSNGERILLDNLLTLSELNKKFVTGSNINSLNQLKKEYEILIGEIEAGNNNELLKKKLYTLLMKFVHFGALSQLQARKQYKEIIKDFF